MFKKLLSTIFLTGSFFIVHSQMNAEMPEPYRSISDLPFDPHGWFGNASQLTECFNERPIHTVIEIGSWLGCSTRFFGENVKPEGKVYAIDTWGGSPTEQVHQRDPRLPFLYQLFLSNIKHAGLTHIVIPIRMSSIEASKALNVTADLIYIDAAHDTNSVYEDILAWHSHLNENGILCGDDWLWQSVQVAVIRATQHLNKTLYVKDNFWRIY